MDNQQLIFLVEFEGAVSMDTVHTSLNMALGLTAPDLAYDADGDGRVTVQDAKLFIKEGASFRYSTTGYMTKPTDNPASTYYAPRVADPGLFRQTMFSAGTTGGKSSAGFGNIVLTNIDGGLDTLVDYGFGNRICTVKSGYAEQALSEFKTEITGTIEQVEFSWGQIIIRLKDNYLLLDSPVQPLKYFGTNVGPVGIEGEESMKDKRKPRLFGNCKNIKPDLVNKETLIYRVNDGAVYDITGVHDAGNVNQILFIKDVATSALLIAESLPLDETKLPTGYVTCKAEGLFRLNQVPVGEITCEAQQGAAIANRTAGQIIKQLAGEKCSPSNVVVQSIIDLDVVAPYELGLYINSDRTTASVLDELCNSVGAWYGFDNMGKFWVKQLTTPNELQSITTITEVDILSVERNATGDSDKGVPIYKVSIDYDKNYTIQTANLAGVVTDNITLTTGPKTTTKIAQVSRQDLLKKEFWRYSAVDAQVKTLHLNSPEIVIPTLLKYTFDAVAEADRQLAMRKVRRDRLRVTINSDAIRYINDGYWDNEAVAELPTANVDMGVIAQGTTLHVLGGVVSGVYIKSVLSLDTSIVGATWKSVLPDLPLALKWVVGETVGNFLYVTGGFTSGGSSKKHYKIDLTNLGAGWTTLADAPVSAFSSTLNGTTIYYFSSNNGVYSYNTVSLVWTQLPVNVGSPLIGSCKCVGSYLYMFNLQSSGSNNTWKLDLSNIAAGWVAVAKRDAVTYTTCAVLGTDIHAVKLGGSLDMIYNTITNTWRYGTATPTGTTSIRGFINVNGSLYIAGAYTGNANTYRYRSNTNGEDHSQLTSLGRTLTVKLPRYGYTSGRPMKIIGKDSNYKDKKITLDLWG